MAVMSANGRVSRAHQTCSSFAANDNVSSSPCQALNGCTALAFSITGPIIDRFAIPADSVYTNAAIGRLYKML